MMENPYIVLNIHNLGNSSASLNTDGSTDNQYGNDVVFEKIQIFSDITLEEAEYILSERNIH